MRKDCIAEINIRGIGKMSKDEVKRVARYLRDRAKILDGMVAPSKPWLVDRKEYTLSVYSMRLMK